MLQFRVHGELYVPVCICEYTLMCIADLSEGSCGSLHSDDLPGEPTSAVFKIMV